MYLPFHRPYQCPFRPAHNTEAHPPIGRGLGRVIVGLAWRMDWKLAASARAAAIMRLNRPESAQQSCVGFFRRLSTYGLRRNWAVHKARTVEVYVFEPILNILFAFWQTVPPGIGFSSRQHCAASGNQSRTGDDFRRQADSLPIIFTINIEAQIVDFLSGVPFQQDSRVVAFGAQ